jgi:hypothetical protein
MDVQESRVKEHGQYRQARERERARASERKTSIFLHTHTDEQKTAEKYTHIDNCTKN